MIALGIVLLAASALAVPALPRIVGGGYVPQGQLPYQVSIRSAGIHLCGGSIIDKYTIISAAHCFQQSSPSHLTVAAGIINLKDESAQVYDVERIINHHLYDSYSKANDIAILKLRQSIQFSSTVSIIDLEQTRLSEGIPCTASGWGDTYPGHPTDDLKYVYLYSISDEKCKESWPMKTESQLCTFLSEGQGTCFGDSGGPLAANGRLVGLVSYGSPCAVGMPDVFTRISSYIDWTRGYMG
ncbi:chymotrypsin-2-like [Photinus pyralis]|uniref:chymotrypsin-2-like n=1 Tax=Photinus pyralis TaxID=7054 RepID=UPI0012672A23|nr:chymotrypsin-2-like [Photinus pyralis]